MKTVLISMLKVFMAKRKRKTLPKDFAQLLENGSLAELVSVFDGAEQQFRLGAGQAAKVGA